MKSFFSKCIHLLMIFFLLSFVSFTTDRKSKDNRGTIQIIIEPVFDGKPLAFESQEYITANGDTVFIDGFRFYLSKIEFMNEHGKKFSEEESYNLVDAEKSSSLKIEIKNIPAGNYSTINFLIGVDSSANVSGAMGGDLDPAKGMYWAWNTGYINAKLEGRSNSCNTLHHAFEFHIGGYLPPYNTSRKISLQLKNISADENKTTVIKVKADVAEWFRNPEMIKLSKTNSVVTPSKDAMMMADNFADMFGVDEK